MRRTKIVCTIGPAVSSHKTIRELAKAGMNVARLNFTYGSQREFLEIIKSIRRVSAELDMPIGILQELAGSKIKIGRLKEEPIILKEGFVVNLTSRGELTGDSNTIPISYKSLPKEVKAGDVLSLNSGQVRLKVIRTDLGEVVCQVVTGGEIWAGKGISLPQTRISLPTFTEKDMEDLSFGLKEGVDMVSLPFVKQAKDVYDVKEILRRSESDIPVIAKIEKWEAIENIDDIIKAADGIMIDRDNLAAEIPLPRLPLIQKALTYKANLLGRPIITATQMLSSMVKHKLPTAVEVTDIANAILDLSDAIMLSEETATGQSPVECIEMMNTIVQEAEAALEHESLLRDRAELRRLNISDAVGYAVCQMAVDLEARAIIALTSSGLTAQIISKYRPGLPIIGVSPKPETIRRLSLFWGVYPLRSQLLNNTDEMITQCLELAKTAGLIKFGDKLIIAGEMPLDASSTANFLKVVVV